MSWTAGEFSVSDFLSSRPKASNILMAIAALVDCLVHHAKVIVLRAESYRIKGKGKELLEGEGRN